MSRLLEVVNLRKRFQMHTQNDKLIPALEDVSFSVEEGEIVALTGKSGSGKSTLMKCVYRTYLSNSGQILYTGESGAVTDLVGASEHAILQIRKSEMTYCSQFLQVIPRVPAIDIVASALMARGYGSEDARELTKDYFTRVSLPEELWDAYPATFSGGEQQRVNIARAIVPRPRFLLVDEPTASLDIKTKDAVIDMILDLKNAGTSVILISHDEHSLQRMADRSLVLEYGRLKEVVYA